MASTSRKTRNDLREYAQISIADIDFVDIIENRTKFTKAQLDNISEDQLARTSKRTT